MNRILIVEDENALRSAYVMMFTKKGFDVYEAAHGKAALDSLDKIKPDIILLDILMPVMGGLEFLEKANLKAKFPQTKVLVLSNLSDNKTISKIKMLQADKYMLKASMSPMMLIGSVEELLTN